MKKLLSLTLIALTAVTSVNADPLADARRRERAAIGRGQGYIIPGPGPSMPFPPRYNDVYGPANTVRWQDMGETRTDKFIDTNIYLNASGQFVNELYLVALENHVQIKSAEARLTNGQVVSLPQLAVTIGRNQQLRIRLDSYYSLRVDQIILITTSPNLFGARGKLQTHLGLAF